MADGHHRSAAAFNVGKIRRIKAELSGQLSGVKVNGTEDFNYFMTLIYPSEDLRIMDYNRVLRTLGGLSSSEFLSKLGKCFNVTKVSGPATARFVMSLYLET